MVRRWPSARETSKYETASIKINHFLGMYIISRKSNMTRLYKKLNSAFPKEYNYYPKSWVCPVDMHELREFVASKKYPPMLI